MTDQIFGLAPTNDPAAQQPQPDSPLHDLMSAFAEPVAKITTVRYELPGRPGWWADFNTNFKTAKMRPILQPKNGDVDPLKVAFAVVAEACTAIGCGDTTVFGTVDRPTGPVGPFRSGEVDEALAGKVTPEPGERAWQASIRWALGAVGDDRPLIQLAGDLQSANLTPVTQVGEAGPTD